MTEKTKKEENTGVSHPLASLIIISTVEEKIWIEESELPIEVNGLTIKESAKSKESNE